MTETMTRGARHAVLFLFVLAMALAGANLLFTSMLVNRASQSAASIAQLCQAGNESRAQQVTLWENLVEISRPPPHETPAARAQREETTRVFLAYVHKVFAARNCHGLTFAPRKGGTS